MERAFLEIEFPDTMPAYADLQLSRSAQLWIAEVRPPAAGVTLWSVVDREGRWLCGVEVPTGFEVLQIDDDRVFGVWKDGLDVEHVLGYRLLKH